MCDNLLPMNTIGHNIKALRMLKGFSQKKLAELCGWTSNSRIANYEGAGDTKREPTLSDIIRIAKVLEVSPASLAFDEFPAQGEFPVPSIKGLPILKAKQVNSWPKNKEQVLNEKTNFLANKISFGLNCYVYQIEDDSMFNFITHEGFRKGAQLIIDPDKQYEINDYVVAKRKDKETLLFRKITDDDGKLVLSALNNFAELTKTNLTSDITICGVVVMYLGVLA